MFKLAKEHPLTTAGLRCVHIVETAELGLRPGDIVFEFPFGRIVDTGMACRRYGIIPPDVARRSPHHPICRPSSSCMAKPVFAEVTRSRPGKPPEGKLDGGAGKHGGRFLCE